MRSSVGVQWTGEMWSWEGPWVRSTSGEVGSSSGAAWEQFGRSCEVGGVTRLWVVVGWCIVLVVVGKRQTGEISAGGVQEQEEEAEEEGQTWKRAGRGGRLVRRARRGDGFPLVVVVVEMWVGGRFCSLSVVVGERWVGQGSSRYEMACSTRRRAGRGERGGDGLLWLVWVVLGGSAVGGALWVVVGDRWVG